MKSFIKLQPLFSVLCSLPGVLATAVATVCRCSSFGARRSCIRQEQLLLQQHSLPACRDWVYERHSCSSYQRFHASPMLGLVPHAVRPLATRAGLKMTGSASGLLFSAGKRNATYVRNLLIIRAVSNKSYVADSSNDGFWSYDVHTSKDKMRHAGVCIML